MSEMKPACSKYFGPSTRTRAKCTHVLTEQNVLKTTSKRKAQSISSKVATKAGKRKLQVRYEPDNWREVLGNIRTMRKSLNAPVDVMGCERCTRDNFTKREKRFHILVSLMLSSQTKDHVTYAAMSRLIEYGLTIENMIEISEEKLGELIYPVGFWKKKVKFLKQAFLMIREEFDGDIPTSVESLVKLPGVGPKMAYLTMNCAWNKVVGIGVDVHVHRISNRLGWVKKAKDPEQTRKQLEDWLPKELWKEVNWLLVGFGQQICLPTTPKCSECLNNKVCPSAKS
uniref:Endonuclease III homolog n=1 Tax=Ciona savignyi TaxID=51511 RepID=H2ZQ65_CIOSA